MQRIEPHLKTIERICLKRFQDPEEGHACFVYVLGKLKEDNQRRIREFHGKSSFKTYLFSVTTRLAIDYFRSLYGRTNPAQTEPNQFPITGTTIGIDDIPELPDKGLLPDEIISLMESTGKKRQMIGILQANLPLLSDEDQLILKMRFWENHKVSQIAQMLSLNQRNLYNRIGRILNRFKEAIKHEGLTEEEINIALEG